MTHSIRVRCPDCGARIKAPIALINQFRDCPRCKRRLHIRTKAPDDAQPVLLRDETPAMAR